MGVCSAFISNTSALQWEAQPCAWRHTIPCSWSWKATSALSRSARIPNAVQNVLLFVFWNRLWAGDYLTFSCSRQFWRLLAAPTQPKQLRLSSIKLFDYRLCVIQSKAYSAIESTANKEKLMQALVRLLLHLSDFLLHAIINGVWRLITEGVIDLLPYRVWNKTFRHSVLRSQV